MTGVFRGIILGAGGAIGVCSQTESLNDVPRFVLRSALNGYDKLTHRHSESKTSSTEGTTSQELQLLTQQIAELKASTAGSRDNKPVIIYGGSTSTGLIKVVMITTTGVVICYYFGYGFNDIMYVTKSTLSTAVKTLEENIGFIGVKLEKTKNELVAKISTVEEMIFATSKDLETQIDNETGKIKSQIGQLDSKFYKIEKSQQDIKTSANRMDSHMAALEAKFDINGVELAKANSGIKLLINSVMDLPHVKSNSNLMGELRSFVSGYTPSWFRVNSNRTSSDSDSSSGAEFMDGQGHGQASNEKVKVKVKTSGGLYNLTTAK